MTLKKGIPFVSSTITFACNQYSARSMKERRKGPSDAVLHAEDQKADKIEPMLKQN